jgi:hypothetical protein
MLLLELMAKINISGDKHMTAKYNTFSNTPDDSINALERFVLCYVQGGGVH